MATGNYRTRFMANNFLSIDDIANYSASSEVIQFPLKNLVHKSRFKNMKFSGNFTIDSNNEWINYYDGILLRDRQIPHGSYSGTELAALIQVEMNVESTDWTCVYDLVTRKFTIDRTVGFAQLFFNYNPPSQPHIWDTLGYTQTVASTSNPFVADEPRNHTDEWIKFDLGFERTFSTFNIISPKNINFPISDQAEFIKIEANNVDDFTAPPLSIDLVRNDNGIYSFLNELSYTYRYIKFSFSDRLNTIGAEGFSFGHCYLGDYITSDNSNIARGFSKKLVDPSTVSTGQTGAEFFRKKTKYWEFNNLDKQLIGEDERVELEQLVNNVGRTEFFYVSFDPLVNISVDISELTKYVRFTNDPDFPHSHLKKYNFNFNLKEVI